MLKNGDFLTKNPQRKSVEVEMSIKFSTTEKCIFVFCFFILWIGVEKDGGDFNNGFAFNICVKAL